MQLADAGVGVALKGGQAAKTETDCSGENSEIWRERNLVLKKKQAASVNAVLASRGILL